MFSLNEGKTSIGPYFSQEKNHILWHEYKLQMPDKHEFFKHEYKQGRRDRDGRRRKCGRSELTFQPPCRIT